VTELHQHLDHGVAGGSAQIAWTIRFEGGDQQLVWTLRRSAGGPDLLAAWRWEGRPEARAAAELRTRSTRHGRRLWSIDVPGLLSVTLRGSDHQELELLYARSALLTAVEPPAACIERPVLRACQGWRALLDGSDQNRESPARTDHRAIPATKLSATSP
jgi:hypothetical protein